MPLSRIEIRRRATAFAKEWANTADEDAEAKSFWDDFFKVFDVSRKRVATFEHHVKKLDGADGFVDLFWPGKLVVEPGASFNGSCKMGAPIKDIKIGDNGARSLRPEEARA